jgi:hypothetical protein
MTAASPSRRSVPAALAAVPAVSVPAFAGAAAGIIGSALADAIAQHQAALAAYHAAPDSEEANEIDGVKNRLCWAVDSACEKVALTPCATDTEFLEKLKYLLVIWN